MADPGSPRDDEPAGDRTAEDGPAGPRDATADPDGGGESADESPGRESTEAGSSGNPEDEEELRRRVEEKYDFGDFGPDDMAEMTAREWDAVFDDDSWITGDELLDRVADDLRRQIADRDVFAVLEEVHEDGERRLLAYSDEGYAVVYPDGGIAGFGTVLRDVKPIVALCSMESYETPEPPEEGQLLPEPEDVPTKSGEYGNLMLQIVAGAQLLVGLGLIGAWVFAVFADWTLTVIAPVIGIVFLLVGIFLFATVANARLSDRFRAEEYRDRLRSAGVVDGEVPPFVPVEDGELVEPDQDRDRATLEAVSPDEDGGSAEGPEPDGPGRAPPGGPAPDGTDGSGTADDGS